MERINTTGHALDEHESLDDEAWRLERLALELRTVEGCPLEYLAETDYSILVEQGLVEKTPTHLRTRARGACLVDSIVEYLA